ADEVAQAAEHRPARGVRDAVREVPGRGPVARRPGVHRARRRRAGDRAAEDRGRHGRRRARRAQRPQRAARPAGRGRPRGHPALHRRLRGARRAEHRRRARRGGGQARVLVGVPGAGRVVRGAAALLAVALGALAYFLVAPSLPSLGSLDAPIIVGASVGLAFVVAPAATPAAGVATGVGVVPAVVGSVLLVAVLDATRAGAAASPFEALFFGCVGVAFAAVLDAPGLAVALPLFVGALDLSGLVGTTPGGLLVQDAARPGDPFTVELPGWGGGLPAARVTGAEIVFLAAYIAYAHLFGLRPRASAIAMYAALVGVVVAGVVFDRRVRALALMGAAFLAVNADRLSDLFRTSRDG